MRGPIPLTEVARWAFTAPILWLTGFVYYHFYAKKKVVLIVSPTRSGSTLLKALLANSEEISHIDEFNFQRGARSWYRGYAHIARLSRRPILVLKRPGWFNELDTYPRLPKYPHKVVLLYREPLPTILSIKKMPKNCPLLTDEELLTYWCQIYENAFSILDPGSSNVTLVRYSDLVSHPVDCQRKLFRWIGTSRYEAKATYGTPESGGWSWQKDDADETIKSGAVRSHRPASDPTLEAMITRSARVRAIENVLARFDSAGSEELDLRLRTDPHQ